MKKLNNKGFTIAEVLVSFSLITVMLVSMVSSTVFYRDKYKQEEVITQLVDFKNTVTKRVYDDIVEGHIVRAERCTGTANCINFVDDSGIAHTLNIVEVNETTNGEIRGVYLYYDGVKYMLPDSDIGSGFNRICDFVGGFEIKEYENRLFMVKTSFKHKDIDIQMDLLFIVS